jgi:hypothetical protein
MNLLIVGEEALNTVLFYKKYFEMCQNLHAEFCEDHSEIPKQFISPKSELI